MEQHIRVAAGMSNEYSVKSSAGKLMASEVMLAPSSSILNHGPEPSYDLTSPVASDM